MQKPSPKTPLLSMIVNLTVSVWLLAQSYNTVWASTFCTREHPTGPTGTWRKGTSLNSAESPVHSHSDMRKLPHGHPQPGLVQVYMWWRWSQWQGLCLQYKWPKHCWNPQDWEMVGDLALDEDHCLLTLLSFEEIILFYIQIFVCYHQVLIPGERSLHHTWWWVQTQWHHQSAVGRSSAPQRLHPQDQR